jgi:lysophospholipase L1-like esterase
MRKALLTTLLAAGMTVVGSAQPANWDYAAFGDSYATGFLAVSGYVPRYQGYLQSDNSVTVTLVNLAQNGFTSGQLSTALATKPTFQTALQNANVVTWDIGTADFRNARTSYQRGKCGGKDNQDCLRSMVSTFMSNWDGIVTQVVSQRPLTTTIVRTMDLYYPWVAQDMATNTTPDSKETGPARGNDFEVMNYYLEQMDAHIASSTAASGIPLAQVHAAFNGTTGTDDPGAKGYIASDGLHPNDTGHEVIAEAFRSLGYAPLR